MCCLVYVFVFLLIEPKVFSPVQIDYNLVDKIIETQRQIATTQCNSQIFVKLNPSVWF